jgi:hypothetical protein
MSFSPAGHNDYLAIFWALARVSSLHDDHCAPFASSLKICRPQASLGCTLDARNQSILAYRVVKTIRSWYLEALATAIPLAFDYRALCQRHHESHRKKRYFFASFVVTRPWKLGQSRL